MSLQAGTRFGEYEVVGPIGAGGMGVVYRARDPHLKRDVALKVLPDTLAGDAGRLARFQREAEVLAALNHANIAHIYGLADRDGVRALVMELVEGRTLADAMSPLGSGSRPTFAPDEAVHVALQIAVALESAHEHGIVHRDLKPANVKITPDGVVKVLDFGLAKALSPDRSSPGLGSDLANTPTITTPAMTEAGVILGTAAYMSPEQARGKVVDNRADIWAFGVVLFEMLTGRAAFAGETVPDILGAIVHTEPDWHALPASTPASLHRLLRRCLERDPRRRLRDIGEARVVLEDVAAGRDESPESPPVSSAPTRRPATWLLVTGAAGAAAIAVVAGALLLAPDRQAGRVVRFEVGMHGIASAAISPDGHRLAIAAQGRLWVRDLALLETREVPGTDGAIRPFWSRDSRTIAYGARGRLWRVAADAGMPSVICNLASGLWDNDAGGAWMADDTIVFSNGNSGLWRVAAQGGDPVEILQPDRQRELHFHNLSGLADGQNVVYVVHRAGEGVGPNTLSLWSAGQARVLYEAEGQELREPFYSPSGHIVFQRSPANAGVWALPFSTSSLEVTGEPFLVAAGVRGPSVAANGTLVLVPPIRLRPLNLAWADRTGKILGRVDEPRIREPSAVISPDGDRVAVVESGESGSDLWLYDLKRNTRSRLTTNEQPRTPVWMPDGRSLLYQGRALSGQSIAIKRVTADGSGRVEEVAVGSRPAVTSDGAFLFYMLADGDGQRLWYRSLTNREASPVAFIDEAFYSVTGRPSLNGQFVAYEAETGATREIYLRRFPPSEGVWQVSSNGGTSPVWSRDGRLFFAQGADIYEVDVIADGEVRLGAPTLLFTRTASEGILAPPAFTVSPDGTRFLIYEPSGDVTEERLVVVQNWIAEFQR